MDNNWKLVPTKITPEMAVELEKAFADTLPASKVHAANWQPFYTKMLAALTSTAQAQVDVEDALISVLNQARCLEKRTVGNKELARRISERFHLTPKTQSEE